MDLEEIVSGRTILEFLGASIRFLYSNLRCVFNDKDFSTFSSFWSPTGSNRKKDENSSSNHMIGVLFLGILIILLILFNA